MAPHTRIGTGEGAGALTAPTLLVVLLVGITGSGKTTLAKALAAGGMVRLAVDEEIHRRWTTWRPATMSCWIMGCGGATTPTPSQ
jgi:signal recognition particle GTPase